MANDERMMCKLAAANHPLLDTTRPTEGGISLSVFSELDYRQHAFAFSLQRLKCAQNNSKYDDIIKAQGLDPAQFKNSKNGLPRWAQTNSNINYYTNDCLSYDLEVNAQKLQSGYAKKAKVIAEDNDLGGVAIVDPNQDKGRGRLSTVARISNALDKLGTAESIKTSSTTGAGESFFSSLSKSLSGGSDDSSTEVNSASATLPANDFQNFLANQPPQSIKEDQLQTVGDVEIVEKNVDSRIVEYDKKIDELMKKLEALENKDRLTEVEGEQDSANEEEKKVQDTLTSLRDELSELKEKKKSLAKRKEEIAKEDKKAAKASTGSNPIQSFGGTSRTSSSNEAENVNNSPVQSTGGSSAGAPPSSSASGGATSSGFSGGSQTSVGALSLEADTGSAFVEIAASQLKLGDFKAMEQLFTETNGKPVSVSKIREDGTEEIVVYEAIQDKDGNITYKEMKREIKGEAIEKKAAPEVKVSKPQTPSRNRIKVEDLNQLLQKSE